MKLRHIAFVFIVGASLSFAQAIDPYEALLLDAAQNISDQQPQAALNTLEALLAQQPNLYLADFLKHQVTNTPWIKPAGEYVPGPQELTEELLLRQTFNAPNSEQVHANVLHLDTSVPYVLALDAEHARFLVLENTEGFATLKHHSYASVGQAGLGKQVRGDLLTPIGLYFVDGERTDSSLPDKYGHGAWTLNYPNALDISLGRTGDGIWIHGVSKSVYSRAPKASEGCVTLSNVVFDNAKAYVFVNNTPVVLNETTQWVTPAALQNKKDTLLRVLETWRHAWQTHDFEVYASFYHPSFTGSGLNKPEWLARKQQINQHMPTLDIQINDVVLLEQPNDPDMILAHFAQTYRKGDFTSTIHKSLWLQQIAGRWQIFIEKVRR